MSFPGTPLREVLVITLTFFMKGVEFCFIDLYTRSSFEMINPVKSNKVNCDLNK